MASRRAGYFRGGDAEPKPLPPLRERICPSLKQLADLDALERELDKAYTVPDKRTGRTLDPEEYFHLAQVLERKRNRINRLAGVDIETPQVEPQVYREPFQWPRPSLPVLTRGQQKVLVIVAVFVFLFVKTQFFS